MDTGIIRLDTQGRVLMMNAAAEHCLCLGRERALGRSLTEIALIPPEMWEALQHPGKDLSGLRLHRTQSGN